MKTIIVEMAMILVISGNSIFSQTGGQDTGANIGFYAGISHGQLKENSLNGLVHSGPGFSAAAVYANRCSNSLHRLELMAGLNLLKTDYEPEIGSFLIQLSARYSINCHVTKLNDRFNLYVGGLAKLEASQGIYTNWDVNHFYWLTAYSIGFNSIANYKISNKSAVSADFGLPVLSLISRPPERLLFHEAKAEFIYVVNQVHQNPSLEFPFHHFNPELRLAYHRKIGNKAIQTIFWRFDYVRSKTKVSREFQNINNALGIEFLF